MNDLRLCLQTLRVRMPASGVNQEQHKPGKDCRVAITREEVLFKVNLLLFLKKKEGHVE